MRRTLFEDASGAFPANVHRNEVAVLRPLGRVSPACDEARSIAGVELVELRVPPCRVGLTVHPSRGR